MGKYFGREPRFTREEIERQAQEAIDARVSMGRPPAEDWEPLEARMDEIDFAIVSRRLPEPPPQTQPLRTPVAPPARPARARRPVPATD
jgi:hypothetical protein